MNQTHYVVPGFEVAGISSGIKKNKALDLALIASRAPCRAAAVFTKNDFAAAPVIYDRNLMQRNPDHIHGVVINSGNANACTGITGNSNTLKTAERVEQLLDVDNGTVHVMSTGVIGVQLPMDALMDGIPLVVEQLRADGWTDAAKAIMTTDTVHKVKARHAEIDGSPVRLTGISKGAGMIHPNMATMLSVITTDAKIAQPLLQKALNHAVEKSFNRISVDGDTSTNDTVLLLANGLADHAQIDDESHTNFMAFQEILTDLSIELAQSLVRDGEGATKFIQIHVNGAASDGDAHEAANTIAISPLCKTAFYGNDANWGRFVMALGRSRAHVNPETCSIFISGGDSHVGHGPELQLVDNGQPTEYKEEEAMAIFAKPEIDVRVDLGIRQGKATVWTCDLSHDYVTINAEYRT